MKTQKIDILARSFILLGGLAFSACNKETPDLQYTEKLVFKGCPANSPGIAGRETSGCSSHSNISSKAAGSWLSPSTWNGNTIPGPCNNVTIQHAVFYPNQSGAGYTHKGNLIVNAQGTFSFLDTGRFKMLGDGDGNDRSVLQTHASFSVTGNFELENVIWTANAQSQNRMYKDLIADGDTRIDNHTSGCNRFVVGDDVILEEGCGTTSSYVIKSTVSPITIGAGPGQTPNDDDQPGSYNQLAQYIFGKPGTSLSQIQIPPNHGPAYVIGSNCVALPVHFESVEAKVDNNTNTVTIAWKTGTEVNSSKFFVEMTKPCTTTPIIVNKDGIPATGTNSQYSYNVTVYEGGPFVFRVIERDLDGKETSSKYVVVHVGSSG